MQKILPGYSRTESSGLIRQESTYSAHTVFKKENCRPLQLADITAHAHTQDKRAIKSGTAPDFLKRNEQGPVSGQPGWSIYEITPDYVARLIYEHNSDRVSKHEDYLRRRQAWLEGRTKSGAP